MVALNPWPSPEGYQFYLESISPFRFRDQLATHLKECQNEITLRVLLRSKMYQFFILIWSTSLTNKHVICVENIFHSKI